MMVLFILDMEFARTKTKQLETQVHNKTSDEIIMEAIEILCQNLSKDEKTKLFGSAQEFISAATKQ